MKLKKNNSLPPELCSQCGICCKLFLINLTKEEWDTGWYKTELKKFKQDDDFNTTQGYGGNILTKKKDESCIYLKNNLCSIYDKRPQSCKDFFCKLKLKKFKEMIKKIKENKE